MALDLNKLRLDPAYAYLNSPWANANSPEVQAFLKNPKQQLPPELQSVVKAAGGTLRWIDANGNPVGQIGATSLEGGGTDGAGAPTPSGLAFYGSPAYRNQVFNYDPASGGYTYQHSNSDGFLDKAIPALTLAAIGGGIAGGFGVGPFASAPAGAGAGGTAAMGAGAAPGGLDLGGGLSMAADGSILGGSGAFTPATAAEMAGMTGGAGTAAMGAAGGAASLAGGGTPPPQNPFATGSGVMNAMGSGASGPGGGFNWGSLIGPGLSAVGGIAGASAANSAADAQLTAAREAQAKLEPWYQAGGNALNRLQELLGIGGSSSAPDYGSAAKDFGAADFQTDPGYQFRQSEGEKALQRAASAQGGIGSGKFLKDAMAYNQGQASQEYSNAFNRFQTSRTNKLNPLQSLAGMGQSTAGTVADLSTQAGNAQAAGKVGAANAFSNALGQGYSMYQNNNLMDKLFQPRSVYGN